MNRWLEHISYNMNLLVNVNICLPFGVSSSVATMKTKRTTDSQYFTQSDHRHARTHKTYTYLLLLLLSRQICPKMCLHTHNITISQMCIYTQVIRFYLYYKEDICVGRTERERDTERERARRRVKQMISKTVRKPLLLRFIINIILRTG